MKQVVFCEFFKQMIKNAKIVFMIFFFIEKI